MEAFEIYWVTYDYWHYKTDPYGYPVGRKVRSEVTRMAIYCPPGGYYSNNDTWIEAPEGYFAVPMKWRTFNGAILPHGFSAYPRVLPKEVKQAKLV